MNQVEYFGSNSIQNLEGILQETKPRTIFLVTGKKSFHQSGASVSLAPFLKDLKVIHFNNLSKIPLLEDVEQGIKIFNENHCDLVVAVGGGLVIDTAKLVNVLASQSGPPIDYVNKIRKIEKAGKQLVAIPTTAGSGSEATQFAVVYANKHKFSVDNDNILPDYSIIDPDFTTNLPPKITASSGMDALCQAIESHWSTGASTESRILSKSAIRLVLGNLAKVVNDPTPKTRLSMCEAANLAGKAINLTRTTAPHAISYPFTYYFGVPHGHAVSLTLGEFLAYNGELDKENASDKIVLEDYRLAYSELLALLNVSNAIDAKQELTSLMREIGLEVKLSELGLQASDLDVIMDNVNRERLSNNPRVIKEGDIRKILESIF